jgi:hypothetical protein
VESGDAVSAALDYLRRRIVQVRKAPAEALRVAASRIESKLKDDARTKRGNVPCFGEMGNIPIRAEVTGLEIHVHGADWVLRKAAEKGQVDEWTGILREEVSRFAEGS